MNKMFFKKNTIHHEGSCIPKKLANVILSNTQYLFPCHMSAHHLTYMKSGGWGCYFMCSGSSTIAKKFVFFYMRSKFLYLIFVHICNDLPMNTNAGFTESVLFNREHRFFA